MHHDLSLSTAVSTSTRSHAQSWCTIKEICKEEQKIDHLIAAIFIVAVFELAILFITLSRLQDHQMFQVQKHRDKQIIEDGFVRISELDREQYSSLDLQGGPKGKSFGGLVLRNFEQKQVIQQSNGRR